MFAPSVGLNQCRDRFDQVMPHRRDVVAAHHGPAFHLTGDHLQPQAVLERQRLVCTPIRLDGFGQGVAIADRTGPLQHIEVSLCAHATSWATCARSFQILRSYAAGVQPARSASWRKASSQRRYAGPESGVLCGAANPSARMWARMWVSSTATRWFARV